MDSFFVYTFVYVIFTALHLQEITGAKVCGLEKLVPCVVGNKTCVITSLEPQLLQWFKDGRPDYYLQEVDSLYYDNFDISVEDGVYHISNVNILGAGNSHLSDFNVERTENEGYINYTYVFNLKIYADSIHKVDENDESITCKKPLALELRDVKINILMPITFIQRCDGSEFMILKYETLNLEGYPHNCVTYESGRPINCDLSDFNQRLIDTVSQLVMRSLNNNYRMIFKLIDVNEFLVVNSDKKPKKPCH